MLLQFFADDSMAVNGVSVENLPKGSVIRFEEYGGDSESYNTMLIEVPDTNIMD